LIVQIQKDMHLFFLESECSVNFIWIVWESNTVFEIVIVQIVFHIVHEESELRNKFSVFVLVNV